MSVTFFASRYNSETKSHDWVFPDQAYIRYLDGVDHDGDPVENPAYRPEVDVTLANGNAAHLLDELGLDSDLSAVQRAPLSEWEERVSDLIKRCGYCSSAAADSINGPGGPDSAHSAPTHDYLLRVAQRLATLIKLAEEAGAEAIYVA